MVMPWTKESIVVEEASARGKPEEEEPPVVGDEIHPPIETMEETFCNMGG